MAATTNVVNFVFIGLSLRVELCDLILVIQLPEPW